MSGDFGLRSALTDDEYAAHSAYTAFNDTLRRVLGDAGLIERRDVTRAALNPLRYLVETAVVSPDLLDHPDHDGWAEVADLERHLQNRVGLAVNDINEKGSQS